MARYIIGKQINRRQLAYTAQKEIVANNSAIEAKILIVRGIGYRAFALKNDLFSKINLSPTFAENFRPVYSGEGPSTERELTEVALRELTNTKYLVVRAGHTRDICLPVNKMVSCAVNKKDRKLTIASTSLVLAANLTKIVYNYRPPSVYTGRGVRVKHERPVRKAGKKDKQRGRAF